MQAKDLILIFCDEWKKKYNKPYIVSWKKDMSIFNALLKELPANELRSLIVFYLQEFDSQFVADGGHTIGIFRLSIPQIIAQKQQLEKEEALNTNNNDFDFKRLLEARKKQS